MFINCLNVIDKKVKSKSEWVLVLCFGKYVLLVMTLFLNKPRAPSFLQVIPLLPLYPYMALSSAGGRATDHDFECNRMEIVARDLYNRCG